MEPVRIRKMVSSGQDRFVTPAWDGPKAVTLNRHQWVRSSESASTAATLNIGKWALVLDSK
jgi:hypothetical protein